MSLAAVSSARRGDAVKTPLSLAFVAILACGCAGTGSSPNNPDLAHGGGTHDFSTGGNDLAGGDLSGGGNDLAGAKDMASSSGDLAGAKDMPSSGDLASSDLAGSTDLATSDLATPDLATTPDMAMCVLFPQSGCGVNEKCELTGSGNICASNGNKTTGQQCGTGGSDDCTAGDICSTDSSTSTTFICRAFCNADGDCKQGAVTSGGTAEPNNVAHCIITFAGTTQKACTDACNPVTAAGASGCPGSLACIYGGTTTIPELTDCGTPGTGTDGASCVDTTGCAAGYVCVGAGAGSTFCRQVCRNGTSGDCSGLGYTCDPPAGVTSPMFGFCCPLLGC